MDDLERRMLPAAELRVEQEGSEPPRIIGYAALFNVESEDLGGWREVILPGAFDAVLGDDVRALWNHDPADVLGRTVSKTLTLKVDKRGLLVEITPPDTERARDHLEMIKRGDVSQMSFAFRVASMRAGGYTWEEADGVFRRLVARVVRLLDVSPVTFPAYTETTVAVRALEAWKAERSSGPGPDRERVARQLALRSRL